MTGVIGGLLRGLGGGLLEELLEGPDLLEELVFPFGKIFHDISLEEIHTCEKNKI